ncbi:enoyl-CoA hydratase/isomerase family protein [Streptomyces sp. NBC_00233]|uniref:enoyl-CoA hydratase/isomerase family protein n=1 Tax=Streptomyces sp. NBC_00233 TaxID=2975686 RepID=UPI0022509821|nr:enoyl-CoA hydratase-related protein [Streptomyces sp. NBC_00233]MCX5230933.1 enoyl-CoA hydratase-related protein [Streptomyces sp. NBC_00233]
MDEELLHDRVRWVRDGTVARIELASPGTRNALDGAMALGLHEAAARLVEGAADGTLRVAVLTAQGPVFSVGGDLRWFAGAPDPSERIAETAALLHETLHTLARVSLPVVSVVHGTVAGGGIGIALGADIVLAGRAAKLRVAYTAAGLSPDCGVSWLLARRVGLARALDLALTNRVVTAAELREWGLVSRVVEQESLADEAEEAVRTLAGGSAPALAATKRLLREAGEPPRELEARLGAEAASIADLLRGPDGREGLSAFLDKRAPVFRSPAPTEEVRHP